MPRATPDGMKVCNKCKENKPVGEFSKRCASSDGLQKACKTCSSAKNAAWRAANLEKVKAKNAAWRAANPEKARANVAAWRAANPDKVKAHRAAWMAANPEKVKAKNAAWRAANPEKVRAKVAAWRAANPDKVKARTARDTAALPDYRVKHYLNLKNAPPELIELKRLQVQIKRELKRQEESK